MKITLISPYPDIASIGIRIISSLLKRAGFATQMIFLPNLTAEKSRESRFVYTYKDSVMDQVTDICQDSMIVGVSLMTNYFDGAVQITKTIKENLNIPVIWGGIHPTIRPEECLDYADIVCMGEGEHAFLELAQNMKKGEAYQHIPNLCVRQNGKMIKNPVRPLVQNMDSLPFQDFNLATQYILDEDHVLPMNRSLLQKALARFVGSQYMKLIAYQTIATRGCPHGCTYCCNNNLRKTYQGQRYVRRRTPENIIQELSEMKSKFPFIQGYWLSDDSFFAASNKEIKEFSDLYKDKLGMPFFCLGSPATINEEKMRYLVEAGMRCIQMGIQTGSEKVGGEIYHRNISNGKVLEAAKTINKYKYKLLPPLYDFILDNPYESPEDVIETVRLLLKLPRPYRLQLFSLILYPGTELYDRAKKDGFIQEDHEQIYRKRWHIRQNTYLNLIFSLARNNFPKFLLTVLAHEKLLKLLNREFMNRLIGLIFNFGRWIKKLVG